MYTGEISKAKIVKVLDPLVSASVDIDLKNIILIMFKQGSLTVDQILVNVNSFIIYLFVS